MKIGDWVKNYRKEHGLSMQVFGDMCGLSKAYISILEKGINPTTNKPFAPTIQTLKKIADVTNTDFEILLHLLDGDQPVTVNSTYSTKVAVSHIPQDEKKLIASYRRLNNLGKKEAVKRVSELGEIEKYCDNILSSQNLTIAASGLDENTPLSNANKDIIQQALKRMKKK